MTLLERLVQAETAQQQTAQLHARAVQAANCALDALARIEGQIVLLRELIAQEST